MFKIVHCESIGNIEEHIRNNEMRICFNFNILSDAYKREINRERYTD